MERTRERKGDKKMTKKELIGILEELPHTVSFVANQSVFVTGLDLSDAKDTLDILDIKYAEETPCAIRVFFAGNCE